MSSYDTGQNSVNNQAESQPWLFHKYHTALLPDSTVLPSLAGPSSARTNHSLSPHLPHLLSAPGAVMVLVMGKIANPCTMALPEVGGASIGPSDFIRLLQDINFFTPSDAHPISPQRALFPPHFPSTLPVYSALLCHPTLRFPLPSPSHRS
ncbi:hypothetical protein B9Z19DRAFT_754107 [Tuber borchii]|uniref:Uncharacterized protein n=1 Tax=Tuber borchii TaxID=42251 RepID=A0A2T7A7V6_TUBBO|nr:hypothetical protein B9Z19DRAFT_754107 [Tuber borchii]